MMRRLEENYLVNKRELGSVYEKLAGKYLEQQGYRILGYNFLCKQGEIDLIAKDDKTIVFVEVKYRKSNSMVSAVEAVNYPKQKKICKAANYYVYSKGYCNQPCRFDVIGFDGDEITHIKEAFDYIV